MPDALRLLTGMEGRAEVENEEVKVYLTAGTEDLDDGTEIVYQPMYGFDMGEIPGEELRDREPEELRGDYEELVRQHGADFLDLVGADPDYVEINVWGEHASQYTDDKASFYPYNESEQREALKAVVD